MYSLNGCYPYGLQGGNCYPEFSGVSDPCQIFPQNFGYLQGSPYGGDSFVSNSAPINQIAFQNSYSRKKSDLPALLIGGLIGGALIFLGHGKNASKVVEKTAKKGKEIVEEIVEHAPTNKSAANNPAPEKIKYKNSKEEIIDRNSEIYNNSQEISRFHAVENSTKVKNSKKLGIIGKIFGCFKSLGEKLGKLVKTKEKTPTNEVVNTETADIAEVKKRIQESEASKIFPAPEKIKYEDSPEDIIAKNLELYNNSSSETASFRVETDSPKVKNSKITLKDKILDGIKKLGNKLGINITTEEIPTTKTVNTQAVKTDKTKLKDKAFTFIRKYW